MNSNGGSESQPLDLERDLPTTLDDIRALRLLRADVPSWLTLDAAELDALLNDADLDRRPTANPAWEPFSLA